MQQQGQGQPFTQANYQGMHNQFTMPPGMPPMGMTSPAGMIQFTGPPQMTVDRAAAEPPRPAARHLTRATSGEPKPPATQAFPDDSKKLSTAYMSLDLVHLHGKDRCSPMKFRVSLSTACDRRQYPYLKLINIEEEQQDMLLYALTGILPSVRPCDMG